MWKEKKLVRKDSCNFITFNVNLTGSHNVQEAGRDICLQLTLLEENDESLVF